MGFFERSKFKLLDPDEIFLDTENLPSFDVQQFEGRIEKPLAKKAFLWLGLTFSLFGLLYLWRLVDLEIVRGQELLARSENNNLRHTPVFAERGVIADRRGEELAWNDNGGRHYRPTGGLAHLLGYISLPTEPELAAGLNGQELVGRDGVERAFDDKLRGERGIRIEEIDVYGQIKSQHVLAEPTSGKNLTLAVDARLQEKFYELIKNLAAERGFTAGSGVILDVRTGEIIALTSFPEYDPNILSQGDDHAAIARLLTDPRRPFLNRATSGLYAPGSVVKPFFALGALHENLISPTKEILSTGELRVPNPYQPGQYSIFKDWRANGWVDMRRALAWSSNVYFYAIGGGFGDQPGLGIARLEKYARLFKLATTTNIDLPNEAGGTIPSPEWKAANFDGERWLLGDTYHTSIGQYGWQVTPLQVVRAIAAIAGGGKLLKPQLIKDYGPVVAEALPFSTDELAVIKEGMRQGVLEGTGKGLAVPYVAVAAKTGTAELGASREAVNSWATGFWPYDNPHYAFIVTMEKGRRTNLIGGVFVIRGLLDWLAENAPEYFK